MHLPRSSVEIIAPPIPAYDTISCLVEKNSAIEWEVLHLAANSSFFGFVPIFFSSPCWRGVFLPDIILQHVLGVQFPVLSPPAPHHFLSFSAPSHWLLNTLLLWSLLLDPPASSPCPVSRLHITPNAHDLSLLSQVPIDHLSIFLGEMSVQILCLFFNWVICLLL